MLCVWASVASHDPSEDILPTIYTLPPLKISFRPSLVGTTGSTVDMDTIDGCRRWRIVDEERALLHPKWVHVWWRTPCPPDEAGCSHRWTARDRQTQ